MDKSDGREREREREREGFGERLCEWFLAGPTDAIVLSFAEMLSAEAWYIPIGPSPLTKS